jgi:hypothetical protein
MRDAPLLALSFQPVDERYRDVPPGAQCRLEHKLASLASANDTPIPANGYWLNERPHVTTSAVRFD